MSSDERDDVRPRRSDEQRLPEIQGQRQGRRRRPLFAAVAVVLFALVVSPFLLLDRSGDDGDSVTQIGVDGTGTSSASEVDHGSDPVASTRSSGLPTSAPSVAEATTTSAPAASSACRNSYDPACGEFRWLEPPMRNDPLTVEVSVSPPSPRAGQQVTFSVVATDDAKIDRGCTAFSAGDDSPSSTCAVRDCIAFGPWSLPPKRADRLEIAVEHTYRLPGTYQARFTFRSGECPSPYGSSESGTATVVVTG